MRVVPSDDLMRQNISDRERFHAGSTEVRCVCVMSGQELSKTAGEAWSYDPASIGKAGVWAAIKYFQGN